MKRSVLTLDTDDIKWKADQKGITLTEKQINDLFYAFDQSDPLMDSFWLIIDGLIDNVDYFSRSEESK